MDKSSGESEKRKDLAVWGLRLPRWVAWCLHALQPRIYPPFSPEELAPRFWGGLMMPARIADPLNYLITGTIGSAKTIHLLLWLRCVVPGIKVGTNQRMVAYDPKNGILKDIHGLGVHVPVKILLPSDIRSVRLALDSMIVSMADAIQFAEAMVPPQAGEKSPFYTNACRSLLAGVMQGLILENRKWDLRDVLLILEDERYLKDVLGRSPQTRSKLRLLAQSEVWMNLQATMEEKFGELRIVAAYWSKAYEELSLDEFLRSEQILVLGKDQRIDRALGVAYQVFFKRLSELILALPKDSRRRIYLTLDEFPRICGDNPVPGFEDLLAEGRDRGVVTLIVFQHIGQIRLRYKDRTDALISYFRNQAFFATSDQVQAEWCAKQCGEERKREWEHSESIGTSQSASFGAGGGSGSVGSSWTYSISARIVDRMILLASTFLDMPLPSKEKGVKGYYRSAAIGLFESVIPGDWIARNLPTHSPRMEGYVRRPDSHQLLEPFGPDDLQRLGLLSSPALGASRPAQLNHRTLDIDTIRAIEESIDSDSDV